MFFVMCRILVMFLLSTLSVLLVAVVGDSTLSTCVAALCGLFLSQDSFTSVNMLIILLLRKTQLPLFNHLIPSSVEDTYFAAGIFNKMYLLESTKSILTFFLFAAARNVIFVATLLSICIVMHPEFNGSKDTTDILGYLLVGIFLVFKLALYSRQIYVLRLIRNPLMCYATLADDVAQLKKRRNFLITILSVINVLFHKGVLICLKKRCFNVVWFLLYRGVIHHACVSQCCTRMQWNIV